MPSARLHQWTRELIPRDNVKEFIVQRPSVSPDFKLALIDEKRGNPYLRGGKVTNYILDIEDFPGVGFSIRASSTIRAEITNVGTLVIKGSVTEGSCVTRRQDLVDQYDDLGYDYFDDDFGRVECYKLVDSSSYVSPGNISYNELNCNHGGLERPHSPWEWDETVAHMFQAVRDEYNAIIDTTSAFRCPTKNEDVGGTRRGKHAYGRAFDYQQLTGSPLVPDTTENWQIALDAKVAGVDYQRILLYKNSGSTFKTLKEFQDSGWNDTNLPPNWTLINRGHIDSGQPASEPR